jgi:hypothetical protein
MKKVIEFCIVVCLINSFWCVSVGVVADQWQMDAFGSIKIHFRTISLSKQFKKTVRRLFIWRSCGWMFIFKEW